MPSEYCVSVRQSNCHACHLGYCHALQCLTFGWALHQSSVTFSRKPPPDVVAQVIIGNNNQASQSTTQTSINNIVNENSAGRRLLGGEGHLQQMPPLWMNECWQIGTSSSHQFMTNCQNSTLTPNC